MRAAGAGLAVRPASVLQEEGVYHQVRGNYFCDAIIDVPASFALKVFKEPMIVEVDLFPSSGDSKQANGPNLERRPYKGIWQMIHKEANGQIVAALLKHGL